MNMLLIKPRNKFKIFDITIVVFLIYITGNPIFRMIYFKQSVIVLFILSIFYYIYKKQQTNNRLILSGKEIEVFLVVAFLSISVVLTVFINISNAQVTTYIAIILQLIATYLCAISIDKVSFLNIYIKVIVFLAFISLIFYSIQIINPDIAFVFPKHQGTYQIYSNAFLYNFMIFDDFGNSYLMARNTGIFWEPGCYQVFLNLGIFFIFSKSKLSNDFLTLKNILFVLILTITVITTKSTTGYITLFVILLSNLKYLILSINKKILYSKNRLQNLILVSLVIIIGFFIICNYNIIELITKTISKVDDIEYMKGEGWIKRLALNKFEYLFTENKFHLFGISHDALLNKYPESKIWNSILEDTIALGYIFSFILIIGYGKFINYFKLNGLILFIILFFAFSTESLFRSPFFLMFVYLGFLANFQEVDGEIIKNNNYINGIVYSNMKQTNV